LYKRYIRGIISCKLLQKDDCEEGSKDKKGNITLEKEIESLYSIVDLIPKSSSEIARESGLSIEKVMAGLIKLQMMGYVEEPSKNQYMKKI
jgi:predicted Rossmann fold nucleotide-binding protein DprA/Smf involved in DNA uptake